MARGLHAGTWPLGLATLVLLGYSSCIHIEVGSSMARCEREVALSAPLEPGWTFSADTDDGSITIR
jgi:hypothetical protein